MKKLLMGNEAIALGALCAGVELATGYPGTPSTEILETLVTCRAAWKAGTASGNDGESPGPDCSSLIHVEWSVNEKSALEVAAGAAWAGGRALITMKQVGLNVASDPLMSLNYLGVQGALVVVVADDPGPISSQTEQDTRHFGIYAKIAVFDPASPEEAYTMIGDAFACSEKYHRPVIFRPTTRVCHSYASVEMLPPCPDHGRAPAGFEKQGGRWVIFPGLSYRSHLKIEDELRDMAEEFSSYRANRITAESGPESRRGIACGGVSRAYVKEILAGRPSCPRLLEIASFPFPDRLARQFLTGLDEVLVVEELDPVIEDALTRLCGTERLAVRIRGKRGGDTPRAGETTLAGLEQLLGTFLDAAGPVPAPRAAGKKGRTAVVETAVETAPPLPVRAPVLCAGCPHRASFFAVKEALRFFEDGTRKAVYSGDIGCYTLGNAPPLDMVDTCLCMGAGITAAQGINRIETSLGKDTLNFAFIGDSTFFHTGIPGIVNAIYNNANIIVVILDNRTTAMTGNQPHPGTGFSIDASPAKQISIPAVLEALGLGDTLCLNPFDFPVAREGVCSVLNKTGVRALVFQAPCIMVSKSGPPCSIDGKLCTGCGNCVRKLGCPAISAAPARGGRSIYRIDPALCTGCGLCRYACAFDAVMGGKP
ncbi:MAG: indolepyruvate ferredoxin oxidoreductase subunit alpha [Treponema sp.]|jgi:indolepyruvate ferredoxin oxidoreductase alpha subunit|nr:indolepyruvate ferredoxin oxidoreductase subunit alpha [Treponema sp.]